MKKFFGIVLAASLAVNVAYADPFDPPASYYNSATGTGASLKSQLHNIIDGHTIRSYGEARSALQVTDADPNQAGRIILVYNRQSLDVSGLFASGIPGWDSGSSWNREHTWPRSRGVGSSGADNSDLHQLRPSNPGINSSRSNLNFGGAFGSNGGNYGSVSDGGTKWYPGNEDAGMIARQQFYMAVRYDGSDSSTSDLELSNGNPSSSTGLGDLNRMIQWHFAATPTEFERNRNQVIYSNYQGNRNPFIDRPEYAWSIFVDQQNDSRIAINGAAVQSNGSSTLDLDFGKVIVGGSMPASQSVTLNKTGLDGTYYQVDTTGQATSTLDGRYNAFRTGTTDSESFTVGLNGNTSSSGVISGSVTVDNLDITTSGGTGRGANDGNDVINLSVSVLDHANPSFAGNTNTTFDTLDFGLLMEGMAAPSSNFSIHNRNISGMTAALDIDATNELADADRFTLTGGAASVGAGSSVAYSVSFATDQVGTFTVGYEFLTSDEDLSGALNRATLQLAASGQVVDRGDFTANGQVDANDIDDLFTQVNAVAADPFYDLSGNGIADLADVDETVQVIFGTDYGDANLDGTVDLLDFGTWRNSFLAGGSGLGWEDGSFNGDGLVDLLDFGVWRDSFLSTGGSPALAALASEQAFALTTVPEPSGALLIILSAGVLYTRRRSRR